MKITPEKDFTIDQHDGKTRTYITLQKGVEVDVPERYIENLITEEVIKKEKKGGNK